MLLRQLVTPFVFLFLVFSEFYKDKRLSIFVVLTFSIVLLFSYPKPHVARLWIACYLVIYGYGCHVFGDHVFAACYAILSAHFGGWLYEVPFWHPASMFYSFRYPWLINTQILSGVFCAWLLRKKEVKVNKTMLLALLCYVMVSVFYITKSDQRFFVSLPLWWLPRVVTMFLLGSLLTGIVGEKRK